MRRIHFDFHNQPNIETILPNFDFSSYAKVVKEAIKCDSVNWFLQDNMGYCYYNTKTGVKHPGLKYDMFLNGLKAFHKENIKVIGYINVALNHRLSVEKPQWVRLDKNGNSICLDNTNPFCTTMCLNTDYCDFILGIIREAIDLYPEIDGIFADNLLVKPCYCNKCKKDMLSKNIDISNENLVTNFAREKALEFAKKLKLLCANRTLDIKGLDRYEDTIKYSDTLYFVPESNSIESIHAKYNELKCFDGLCLLDGRFVNGWEDFGGYRSPNDIKTDINLCDKLNIGFCLGEHIHPNFNNTIQESYYKDFNNDTSSTNFDETIYIYEDGKNDVDSICYMLKDANVSFKTVNDIKSIPINSKVISYVELNKDNIYTYYFCRDHICDSIDDKGISYCELQNNIISIYDPKCLFKDGFIKHIKPYNQIENRDGIPYYMCPLKEFDNLYLCNTIGNTTYCGFDIFDSYQNNKNYKYVTLLKEIITKKSHSN